MKILLTISLLLPMMAFAQDAPTAGFEWVDSVLAFLSLTPVVGPYVVGFAKAMAVLSVSLTALAVFLEALLSAPEIAARLGNAQELADKIKRFKEKILPWVKKLSMFNVQKKK